jgi:GNAT superfamily N-acetyltransferase
MAPTDLGTFAVSIRPAREAEMRACRMLLPDAFQPDRAPIALVACAPDATSPGGSPGGSTDGALIGAAAINWAATGDPPAFQVMVHVLADKRRGGVGRALLNATEAAVRGEAPALQPWSPLTEGSEAASFCLANGFTLHHRMLHFAAEAAALEAMLATYRAKLDRAGWIPPGARVVALHAAPAPEVAQLVSREFHLDPAAFLARLRGAAGRPFDAERSVVLLLDGKVVGAQMASLGADGIPDIEANVVIPTLRRGWANLLLNHESARVGLAKGSRRFRFFCDERVIDTVNFARRGGAERTRTALVLMRDVPAGDVPAGDVPAGDVPARDVSCS